MRLIVCLTMACATSLTTGCAEPPVEIKVSEEALFCDVEQPRRFTRDELDWRAANAPDNLRLDIKTNTTWDRECAS